MKKLLAVLLTIMMLSGAAAALAEDYAFGTDTAFRPFEYTDETGTLVGIDVEKARWAVVVFLLVTPAQALYLVL